MHSRCDPVGGEVAAGSCRRLQWLLWDLDQGVPGGPTWSLMACGLPGTKCPHYCLGTIPGKLGEQGSWFRISHKLGHRCSHCLWASQPPREQQSAGVKGTGFESWTWTDSWSCALSAK